jgi:hypothetical protein
MTDHLIRAVELLAKIAERLAMVDARLGEGVERIAAAVAALSKQLTAGGVRAGKAEKALGEKVEALPTSEVLGAMFADLRAREDERHGAQIAVLARIEARLAAIETRPAPTTWADLFGKHPALVLGLAAVLAALAGWLGGQVPTLPGRVEQAPPTAVLPGAGSRLMNDRRLADGSEG